MLLNIIDQKENHRREPNAFAASWVQFEALRPLSARLLPEASLRFDSSRSRADGLFDDRLRLLHLRLYDGGLSHIFTFLACSLLRERTAGDVSVSNISPTKPVSVGKGKAGRMLSGVQAAFGCLWPEIYPKLFSKEFRHY